MSPIFRRRIWVHGMRLDRSGQGWRVCAYDGTGHLQAAIDGCRTPWGALFGGWKLIRYGLPGDRQAQAREASLLRHPSTGRYGKPR